MKNAQSCFGATDSHPNLATWLGVIFTILVLDSSLTASEVMAFGPHADGTPVLTNAVAVSVMGYSLAALRADGTVALWANGRSDPAVSNIVSISTGSSHGFGLQPDGSIIGWGSDYARAISGKPPDLTNVLALAVGMYSTLAIRTDGTVVGWGENGNGVLDVPEGLSNVVAITIGTFNDGALALRADGTVIEWGKGITNRHPEISNAVAVAAACFSRRAVLHFDGTVTAWPIISWDDVAPSPLTNILTIAGGGDHLLALGDNGKVVCWGCDSLCYSDFVSISNLTHVTAIAAGGGDGYDYSIFLMNYTNPPPFLRLSQTENRVHLVLSGLPYHRYVLEETADPTFPDRWALGQNLALPCTAQMTLHLPISTPARFYRARLIP